MSSAYMSTRKARYLYERNLADALTITRLYAIIPISAAVVSEAYILTAILYGLAILTDALDGWVARRQHTASQNGADLDGVIDFWFTMATLWWLYKINPEIYTQHALPILLGVVSFGIFMAVSHYKHKKIILLHLPSAKVTTTLFALWLPAATLYTLPGWLVWLTMGSVLVSRYQNTRNILGQTPNL